MATSPADFPLVGQWFRRVLTSIQEHGGLSEIVRGFKHTRHSETTVEKIAGRSDVDLDAMSRSRKTFESIDNERKVKLSYCQLVIC